MKPVSTNTSPWKVAAILSFLVALIAIGFSVKTYMTLQRVQDPAYQQEMVQKETKKLLDEVSKLYLLPEGNPQIAIVSDPEALKKGQPFFEKAMIGDRIIVYPEVALLYRTSTKQIINVWPVTQTPTAPAPETPKQ